MSKTADAISKKITEVIKKANEPLETSEFRRILKNVSRVKLLYRLHNLRGESVIKGKSVGSGKGTWIWWIDNKGNKK